jgi:large subunit ribosomal protein L18
VSLQKKNQERKQRRAKRVHAHVRSKATVVVSVFRSLNHIYAQVIDTAAHKTLASCSTVELENLKGDKKEQAKAVGKTLAERVLPLGLENIAFDRGAYRYHGRVQALAEGLREGGLVI